MSIRIKDNESYKNFETYDEFISAGHEWTWCLVGNIVESHEYGQEHEIRYGTKQFGCGAKVYCAPIHWSDGYEDIIVIGVPRHSKCYIEIVMP